MSLVGLIGRVKGHVVVCAEGCFTERFINICMHRRIFLWDVHRAGENRIYASVNISDFARLRPVARKTRTRVRISKRCGLPFFLHRYRKRRVAAVGALLFAVIVWYCSSHVAGIDVFGNERITTETLLEELAESGIYRGAALRKIDYHRAQNLMMTKLDDIAWIGINIKGARVSVEVKERLDTKREVGADIPCNLVASKAGVIRRMEVREGQSMVKAGDMAEEGELLVSGAVDSTAYGIRYVHSFGAVYAETVYKDMREYGTEYTEKVLTGAKTKRYSIKTAGKTLKLYLDETPPYEHCDKQKESRELSATILHKPILSLECEVYSEYKPRKKTRTIEETVEQGKKELDIELREKIPRDAEIKEKNVSYRLTDSGAVAVSAEYVCEENIAVQSPLTTE